MIAKKIVLEKNTASKYSLGLAGWRDDLDPNDLHRFSGTIRELRISSIDRYQANFVPKEKFETDQQTELLLHLNEGKGNVAVDSSGHNHDVTINGAKWVRVDRNLNIIKTELPTDANDSWAVDREVAEWVIEEGGQVTLLTEQGESTPKLGAIEDLPDQPFYVVRIYFPWDSNLDSAKVSQLSRLQNVRTLAAARMHLSEDVLQSFGDHPRLYMAHFQENPVKSSELSHSPLFPSLNRLGISNDQIDDAGEFLTRSSRLHNLILHGASEQVLQSFVDSGNLASSRLKSLELPCTIRPRDSLIKNMQAAKPDLRIIWTSDAKGYVLLGQDPVAEAVGQLMEQGFRFEGNYLNGEAWSSNDVDPRKADVPISIEKFFFPEGFTMTEPTLELMRPIRISAHLSALEMKQTHLIVEYLSHITIGRLYLEGSDLDDAGLLKLSENGPVGSIDVRGTRVTREGIERVKRMRPDLVIQSDSGEFGIEPPKKDNP